MNFYEKAIIRSESFIKDSILKYDQLRNYDFGPTKRDNVSGLSPFFSHRILFEYHLIDKILQMHQYSRVEKFNPKTGKYQTFRTFNVKPIDPVASFYRKKRK